MKDNPNFLKYQAFLDEEISGSEARKLKRDLEADSHGREVLQELRDVRALLRENEPQVQCPMGREFYWSQIERQIAPRPQQAVSGSWSVLGWLRHHLLASSGVGAAALVAVFIALQFAANDPLRDAQFSCEFPDSEVQGTVIRSESENTTLIWLAQVN